MNKDEIQSQLVDKIDSKMDSIRESTTNILESLIDIRSKTDEIAFLETLLNEQFKN